MLKKDFDNMQLSLGIKVVGVNEPTCMNAVNFALDLLDHKLPASIKKLIHGTEVEIVTGAIESGALTNAEEKKITLDAKKNELSLVEAENLLVKVNILRAGDWVKALTFAKNEPWSCLTYQLVHEFGHLIDGISSGDSYNRLSPKLSPTKYGSTSSSESFAENFAYWIFDLDIDSKASRVIESLLHS
jgi:hypothetical protein